MASPRGSERIDIADGGYIAWANPATGGRVFEVTNRQGRSVAAVLSWARLRQLHTALGPAATRNTSRAGAGAITFGGSCHINWQDSDGTGCWVEMLNTTCHIIAVPVTWAELSDIHYALGVTLGRTQT
jgi:hypothetical protein